MLGLSNGSNGLFIIIISSSSSSSSSIISINSAQNCVFSWATLWVLNYEISQTNLIKQVDFSFSYKEEMKDAVHP